MIRDRGPITVPRGNMNNHRRGSVPANYRSVRPPYQNNFMRDRPPGPPSRPNFVIELRSDNHQTHTRSSVENLMKNNFKCRPDSFFIYDRGTILARFFYQQWTDVLETVVHLWESRLNGEHMLIPKLVRNLIVPSDTGELNDRLRELFSDRVKGFIDGDLVNKWENKLGVLSDEIARIDGFLRKPNKLAVVNEWLKKKEGFVSEKDLIARKIREFKCGMQCIHDYLEGKVLEDSEVKVLRLKGAFDWWKIHCLMIRECRRLDDGLPIYAFRQEILSQIHCQQVMVLIGETGSGKSTQLVQFLADSGIAGNKSLVCTQPRKLAATSLAHRVMEETSGCFQDASVVCSPFYSSLQQFDSNVIYMTDNCLLQHYMNDNNLSRISCIIIDEAHERSLNTDLLLALIKKLLQKRLDLRLIIMSATADAEQLADYFFRCGTFHVVGRSFPVDIRYVPCVYEVPSGPGLVASYVSDVVRMVTEIHRMEEEGAILAFLTSQMEVEWACEQFQVPSAVALALHGKLSHEDQYRVYLKYPGKRKVIFSTNLAETSLTIPGVKYVVDSGMVKESRFDPGTGMNVLRVCRTSQSSANQRAGRAGRTEPGKCYRLYEENDFKSMPPHQEPEICRVHLGVAVLRILALGIKNVEDFDFINAPCTAAIEMAIRNLIQLGAVTLENGIHELTKDGKNLVRLGIEPRLGKIILKCFDQRLGREGLVLAAVMANSSNMFCRVGKEEDKQKSDRLKVQFCHCDGDLFTLLSVYKKWEAVPHDKKNQWSWDNSINAKSMRRCQETVHELESCLQHDLNIIIPSYWQWNPEVRTEHDRVLKNVILSSLAENVAMYSGYDQLGYEVALTGKHVQLHPSCSLLIFSERPTWVVFGEIRATSNQYLFCVNAVNFESLYTLHPPPLFDISEIDSRKLQVKVFTGYGRTLLKKFCGKSNSGLIHLVSRIRTSFMDDRIGLKVNVDQNEVTLFASSQHMEEVSNLVYDALEHERKWLRNECLEKCLYQGGRGGASSSLALFGAGAEIKHLELEKRCLTVDVYHSDPNAVDDKELLMFLERNTSGSIGAVHKFSGNGQDYEKHKEWGRITFLTPDAAENATKFKQVDFMGTSLRVVPSRSAYGGDNKLFSFPAVRAEVSWCRRPSNGVAFVKCEARDDVAFMVQNFSNVLIGGKNVLCSESMKYMDSVMLSGLDRDLCEAEIFDTLRAATNRKILNVFLVRGNAVEYPPFEACEAALLREISPFMPKRYSKIDCIRIQVFPPKPKDHSMRASILFDASLHLEAAKALEQIEGKVLPGCRSWQKIKCQQLFHSSVFCLAPVYKVIKDQLCSLLASFKHRKGAECTLSVLDNGSCRVKISANATKTMAELRRPLEHLMNGKTVHHPGLTPTVRQLLFSREGSNLQTSIQKVTGTYIHFDRRSLDLKVFGPLAKTDMAQQRLVQSLLALHESKQLDIHLRGSVLPPDLMKKMVEKFGPDLHGLKEKFPGAEFTLNTRRHIISINGNKELKQKVEEIIHEIVQMSGLPTQRVDSESPCPICLCEVEDSYRLENCAHEFCRLCLIEQCESAINSQDTFPIRCCHKGCGETLLMTDLRTLLTVEKLEELFRASLGAFVATSGGKYRFCPSPDCPSVYRVAEKSGHSGAPFMCGVCAVETCTRCHMEYHPYLSCEKYREFKEDPDSSLKDWCKGKEHVKHCPVCGFTIEKIDGCNHVECKCGRHICWVCLEFFANSDECYGHLRSIHLAII